MSVTLQLSLLHLTYKFLLDKSFMRPRLFNVLLLELNDITVMPLSWKCLQSINCFLNVYEDLARNAKPKPWMLIDQNCLIKWDGSEKVNQYWNCRFDWWSWNFTRKRYRQSNKPEYLSIEILLLFYKNLSK